MHWTWGPQSVQLQQLLLPITQTSLRETAGLHVTKCSPHSLEVRKHQNLFNLWYELIILDMQKASPGGHIHEHPLWCLCSRKQCSNATIISLLSGTLIFVFNLLVCYLTTPCMATKCNHRAVTFRRIPNRISLLYRSVWSFSFIFFFLIYGSQTCYMSSNGEWKCL